MNFLGAPFFVFDKINFLRRKNFGFSIVEAIVGVAVFALVSIGVYGSFLQIFDISKLAHVKILAVALANEQYEIIRNLPYSDVGITGGIPDGVLPHVNTVTRDGVNFSVTTTIRNIDDAFDGKIDTTPKDLSPADYKLVEVVVGWGGTTEGCCCAPRP
jgi:type II secretory pathway pseudopilin PulG